jgi:SAM-dependent methyltransferase
MQQGVYDVEAAVEESHWWFVGRRALVAREIAALGIAPDDRVLDIGTSTGTNLRLLGRLGFRRVAGVDLSLDAIRYCAQKDLGKIEQADVCSLPFADRAFKLVLATDIVEHVDDDVSALKEIGRVLDRGGRAIVTVPCFESLWGLQDDVSFHKRRYRLSELVSAVEKAGLRVSRSYYFNYMLFLPILIARRVIALLRIKLESENQLNNPLINRVLRAVFRADVESAPWLHVPFGVSAFALVVKD